MNAKGLFQPDLQAGVSLFLVKLEESSLVAFDLGLMEKRYRSKRRKFAVFCRLSAKLINGIKGLKLTANSGCVRFLISEINVIFLVGIKFEAMREVAIGGTSSDKQPFYSGTG